MRRVIFASVMILGMTGTAFAQYSGLSESKGSKGEDLYTQTTIKAVIDNPNDGDRVSVEGMLIQKLGDEMYLLSDGTSEINIEIDDDDFPNRDVSETTRVKIEGEVDTHLMREVDIETDRVIILD